MEVLVTGSRGFIGRHVVREILEQTDWRVIALDSGEPEPGRKSSRLRTVNYDLRESPMAAPWCENVDAVVNLASSSDVVSFLKSPFRHTMNNVRSTLNLLEWARHRKLRGFIQVSTNEVYGPAWSTTSLTSEWDALKPQTPYSASKACQEMLAIGWRQTYGVPVAIVNTMHVFGEGQPSQRFIPTAVDKILRGEPVPLFHTKAPSWNLDGVRYGAQVRNWTYAGDLARALIWLLQSPDAEIDRRVDRWNVAGPEVSCLEIVRLLGKLLNHSFAVEWISSDLRPGHDFRYALSREKLDAAGFEMPYGFEEGLRRTVDEILSERKKLEA